MEWLSLFRTIVWLIVIVLVIYYVLPFILIVTRYAWREIDKQITPIRMRASHYEATFEEDPATFIEPKINIVPLQQLPSPFESLPDLVERKLGTLPLMEENRIKWRIRIRNQCQDWKQKLSEELNAVVPREPTCIICTEQVVHPVICVNRHACCRICIEAWGRGCPLCKKEQLWQLPQSMADNLPQESIAARLSAVKNHVAPLMSNDNVLHPSTVFFPTDE
jgi:hypothetical protein